MEKAGRVFLKLSGEALAKADRSGYDLEVVENVARQVKTAVDQGTQVGIVIGAVV